MVEIISKVVKHDMNFLFMKMEKVWKVKQERLWKQDHQNKTMENDFRIYLRCFF